MWIAVDVAEVINSVFRVELLHAYMVAGGVSDPLDCAA